MGIFVNYPSNIFASLKHIPTNIVSANSNVLWVTDINICNRGAAPIRLNIQKTRVEGFVSKTVYAASTVNIPNVIYNNGTNGVGATLTNNSPTLTTFTIDGTVPLINSRILIKDQVSPLQNGIYTVTTAGSNSIPWVLTRATDYNKTSQIHTGDLIFITNGSLNTNTKWNQTSTVTIMGTSIITFLVNIPSSVFLINELEIKPYSTIDLIDTTGVIHLQYNNSPYISDSLVCFSNGYTQLFDCDVNYVQLNELPTN